MKKLLIILGFTWQLVWADYAPPQELSYAPTPPSKISKENKPEYDPLISKFYPIGWGKKGEFAYITEPADEACGCYFFELTIIDKEGKVIWKWKPEEEPEDGSVAQMWKDNEVLFKNKLVEYGIKQEKIKLLAPENYGLKIQIKKIHNEFMGGEVVGSSEFFQNDKSIFTKNYGGEYDLNLAEGISGVILGESENQGLILVNQERRGYEGVPNVMQFYLVPLF